jgi:hypothetical protein
MISCCRPRSRRSNNASVFEKRRRGSAEADSLEFRIIPYKGGFASRFHDCLIAEISRREIIEFATRKPRIRKHAGCTPWLALAELKACARRQMCGGGGAR